MDTDKIGDSKYRACLGYIVRLCLIKQVENVDRSSVLSKHGLGPKSHPLYLQKDVILEEALRKYMKKIYILKTQYTDITCI